MGRFTTPSTVRTVSTEFNFGVRSKKSTCIEIVHSLFSRLNKLVIILDTKLLYEHLVFYRMELD